MATRPKGAGARATPHRAEWADQRSPYSGEADSISRPQALEQGAMHCWAGVVAPPQCTMQAWQMS